METKQKTLTDYSIESLQQTINDCVEKMGFIHAHKTFLDENDLTVDYFAGKIDFNKLEHEKAIKVIRYFGGKWTKTYRDGVVDYETTINGKSLRIWSGKPPANCKLIEYEEVIPAQTIPARTAKKFKLQCREVVSDSDMETSNASLPTN